jgi:hypothetical protein
VQTVASILPNQFVNFKIWKQLPISAPKELIDVAQPGFQKLSANASH